MTRNTTAEPDLTDSGLLSPVRAGTEAEEAVSDFAWLQAMLDAEAALARAQARLGTIPESAAVAIGEAARAESLDLRALALASRETANPVVGLVKEFTRLVAERDASAARYVHCGSTSQDIFDTGAMLVCSRVGRLLLEDLDGAAVGLAHLAAEHRGTPAVGRTLALHAVPTTFGLKVAGWRQLVLDASNRLRRILDGGLPVSLGGAAGTLAGYLEHTRKDGRAVDQAHAEQLVDAFADETGLARPILPWHACRTPIADLASALSFASTALGKIAVDVQVLARTEIGEVTEPHVSGRGGSSAMPHKRNPVLSTLIRSAAQQVPLQATVLHQSVMSEDERSAGAWHAEWLPLRECLRLTGGAAHTLVELVEGLVVRPERMRSNLDLTHGQVVTERLAAALTPLLGRDEARALLNRMSVLTDTEDRPLWELLVRAPELSGTLTAQEIVDLFDPASYTGAATALVDRSLR